MRVRDTQRLRERERERQTETEGGSERERERDRERARETERERDHKPEGKIESMQSSKLEIKKASKQDSQIHRDRGLHRPGDAAGR